jgi:CheY-like chemotaxis protein
MGTQPLQRESSLRKPSRIGEEIRKELEKRGLRAPKPERSKPNGKKITSAFDVPVQITVDGDSTQEIDVEIKPVDQIDDETITEQEHEAAAETDTTVDGLEEADLAEKAIVLTEEFHPEAQDDAPIIVEEAEEPSEFEGPLATVDSIDTKPLTPADLSGEKEIAKTAGESPPSEPVILVPPKVVLAEPEVDRPAPEMHEDPELAILPPTKSEETDVEIEGFEPTEEQALDTDDLPNDELQIGEGQLDKLLDEEDPVEVAKELPETAELDNETITVLRSYKNVKSFTGRDSEQADKVDVIESLLSIASHELRSPLQAISGFLELLINKGAADIQEEEQFLSIAYRESNHLADIVADLETAALIESGKLKIRSAPYSMERLLQSCIQRFNLPAWEGKIFLEDSRIKDIPELYGDEIYLRQALNNLIGAVLRPLHSDSHVFIRTIVEEDGLILQVVSGEENPSDKTLPDLRAARAEFHDITQEGFGIFVARHLIEAHGGALMRQGTQRDGLTITIQLPFEPRLESKGTILITEDNTHAALLLEYALERDGYIPIKATNGLEALEIVANDNVDLVILDVVLPGMDGFEICYRMRSSHKTAAIPVVIVSAKSGDEYGAKALLVGADAYFEKPLVLADLLSTLESLLENVDINASDDYLDEIDPD